MKHEAAGKTTQSVSGKNDFTLGRLALDFADTAWRIAIPVVLLALVGIFADKSLDTAPWLTLLGTLLGFGLAAILIKNQIASVQQRESK